MPLKVMHRGFFEVMGEGYVLLTAPHAAGPVADLLTGEIVEEAAGRSKCHAIIGNTSREKLDLNRAQAWETEFRESINQLVEDHRIRLIIDVHGKQHAGVEVGTAEGTTASAATTEIVRRSLAKYFATEVNKKYKGLKHGSIVTSHVRRDQSGFLTEAVQIELGLRERYSLRNRAVDGIVEIASIVNRNFGAGA